MSEITHRTDRRGYGTLLKRLAIVVAVMCTLVSLSAAASAQDLKKGLSAYSRGDYVAALREFRPLAERGDSDAMCNLANMYFDGDGVVQDYVEAHMWYNLCAALATDPVSHGDAAASREIVASRMTPADISKAQRLAHEWLAAFEKRQKK